MNRAPKFIQVRKMKFNVNAKYYFVSTERFTTLITLIFPVAVTILHFAEDHQLYGHHGDNITSLIGMKSLDESFL